jgi:endogenous inhibitor of DNA gyrase (YacG/DUF329 family)
MSISKMVECPTCHKKNTWKPDNPFRPFCSDRCKLIDLGEWADENHRIEGSSEDKLSSPDEDDSAN